MLGSTVLDHVDKMIIKIRACDMWLMLNLVAFTVNTYVVSVVALTAQEVVSSSAHLSRIQPRNGRKDHAELKMK